MIEGRGGQWERGRRRSGDKERRMRGEGGGETDVETNVEKNVEKDGEKDGRRRRGEGR